MLVSSGVRARGDLLPTLIRADESRTRLTATAPSSMASPNIPDGHASADFAALGPCRSAMARSARLTTPAVTSRSRSSPNAGTTWVRVTDLSVRPVPVDQPRSASSQSCARSDTWTQRSLRNRLASGGWRVRPSTPARPRLATVRASTPSELGRRSRGEPALRSARCRRGRQGSSPRSRAAVAVAAGPSPRLRS